MKQFLNAAEVAKLLEVDRATVIRWIARGFLEAERIGKSRWRIRLSTYERLVQQRK